MKKLSRKLSIATLWSLGLSVIMGFIAANLIYYGFTKNKVDEQNAVMAEEIADTLVVLSAQKDAEQYLKSVGEMGYQLLLVNQDGALITFGDAFEEQQIPKETLQHILAGQVYHGMQQFDGHNFFLEHFSNNVQNAIGIRVSYAETPYAMFIRPNNSNVFSDMHVILGSFLGSIAIVSIIGVYVLSRRLIRPISELTLATKAVANDNYTYPLTIERDDEIGELATSFRVMQAQLVHDAEARKAFISNVSHDFQSPLLNIQGYASLLRKDVADSLKPHAEIIESEAKRLSTLTKQLLLLTSLEQATYPTHFQPFDLTAQLKYLLRNLMWRAEEKEIEVSYQLAQVDYNGDAELMYNVWENVLSNAFKYTPPGGAVDVVLEQKAQAIEVTIRDTGIGLSKTQQAQIFDRFYRVDDARKKDGTGLGLAIVDEIVRKHSGEISIESKEQQGTAVKIVLPC